MADLSEFEWRRSSLCANATCVEVAVSDDQVAMRDSKDRLGSILKFDRLEWREFLAGALHGEFDPPSNMAER